MQRGPKSGDFVLLAASRTQNEHKRTQNVLAAYSNQEQCVTVTHRSKLPAMSNGQLPKPCATTELVATIRPGYRRARVGVAANDFQYLNSYAWSYSLLEVI